MIRCTLAALFAVTLLARAENPPGIPADYQLVYSQDFSKPDAVKDFTFTDPAAWTVSTADGQAALELTKQSSYQPPVRSPVNIALLANKVFGDVIIEAVCQQTGKEYGHRDMIFVYGFQSPSKYYYTHIATKGDDHAHNCFVVNDAPRAKFASDVTTGANWGLGEWHHIRIERKASVGTVRIFFDDMAKPIMTGNDKTFGAGAIGFGSFDDTGKITGIKVWSPAIETKTTEPFAK